MQSTSPRKRRYRICPQSSRGFRESNNSPSKLQNNTCSVTKIERINALEPWEFHPSELVDEFDMIISK
jgi:hypothetical protein